MAQFPFFWDSLSSATISPTKTATHQSRYRQRQINPVEPEKTKYRYSHLNKVEPRKKLYSTSYRNLNYRPRPMPTGSYPCTATTGVGASDPTTEQGFFAWAYAAVASVVNGPSTTTLIARKMENQNPDLSQKISSIQTREEYVRQHYGYTGSTYCTPSSH